jgi:hypothetical protein
MRGLVMIALAACTHRNLEISDRLQTLPEAMMPGEWSTTGGTLQLNPRNTNTFPSPLTLRTRIYEPCGDNDECDFELKAASISVVTGSPCSLSVPASCSDIHCFAELTLTGLGNCLVQVTAETNDGYSDDTCWYRAVYEADDPYDQMLFAMYEQQTDDEVSDCNSSL